ncbi:MAG: hypothetical protein FJ308_14120 [Planctomycetes bacterium]|nr:hypothetical protein [Planctomycetota bacterium]
MGDFNRSSDMESSREALRKRQEALALRLTTGNRSDVASKNMNESIAGLSRGELESAAETLIRKRVSQTSSHLPMTRHLLGDEFLREFRLFGASHHFNGYRAHWFDAWFFAEYLKRQSGSNERVPWLVDCLKLEQMQIGLELYQPRFSMQRLKYQVHLWRYDRDPSPRKKACLLWSWRIGRWRGIRMW